MTPSPISVLAIDTTSEFLSLAVRAGDRPAASRYLLCGNGTSRVLFREIDALLAEVGIAPAGLELLLVAVGPGSFTGTRIGMAAAATFAQVTGRPLIGVDTLHLLAAQSVSNDGSRVHAVLNCVRDEVYHAPYVWRDGQLEAEAAIALSTIPELAAAVGDTPVVLRRFPPAPPEWDDDLARLKRAELRSSHPDGLLLLEAGIARFRSNRAGPFPRPEPIYLKSEAFRKWSPAAP